MARGVGNLGVVVDEGAAGTAFHIDGQNQLTVILSTNRGPMAVALKIAEVFTPAQRTQLQTLRTVAVDAALVALGIPTS